MGYENPLNRRQGRQGSSGGRNTAAALRAVGKTAGDLGKMLALMRDRKERKEFQDAYLKLAREREDRQAGAGKAKAAKEAKWRKDNPLSAMAGDKNWPGGSKARAVSGSRRRQKGKTSAQRDKSMKKLRDLLDAGVSKQADVDPNASDLEKFISSLAGEKKQSGQRAELEHIARVLENMEESKRTGVDKQFLAPDQPGPGAQRLQSGMDQRNAMADWMGGRNPPGVQQPGTQGMTEEAMGGLQAKQTDDPAQTLTRDQSGLGIQNQYAAIVDGRTPASPEERMAAVKALTTRYMPHIKPPLAMSLEEQNSPNPQSPVEQIKDQNKPYSARKGTPFPEIRMRSPEENVAPQQPQSQPTSMPTGGQQPQQPQVPPTSTGAPPGGAGGMGAMGAMQGIGSLLDAVRQIGKVPQGAGAQQGPPSGARSPMPPMPDESQYSSGQRPSIQPPTTKRKGANQQSVMDLLQYGRGGGGKHDPQLQALLQALQQAQR